MIQAFWRMKGKAFWRLQPLLFAQRARVKCILNAAAAGAKGGRGVGVA